MRTLIATLVGREELSTRPTEGLVLPPPPPAEITIPAVIPPAELPRALVGLLRAEYADLAARLTGDDRRRAEAHVAHLAGRGGARSPVRGMCHRLWRTLRSSGWGFGAARARERGGSSAEDRVVARRPRVLPPARLGATLRPRPC